VGGVGLGGEVAGGCMVSEERGPGAGGRGEERGKVSHGWIGLCSDDGN
jgi:hypothetical protein